MNRLHAASATQQSADAEHVLSNGTAGPSDAAASQAQPFARWAAGLQGQSREQRLTCASRALTQDCWPLR